MWGIGVDADQAYLGTHILTSATKKVDVAVFKTIEAAKAGGAGFKTNFNAIFTVKNGGVGYGKISSKAQPSWKRAVEGVRLQIASGKIKVTAQAPPAALWVGAVTLVWLFVPLGESTSTSASSTGVVTTTSTHESLLESEGPRW